MPSWRDVLKIHPACELFPLMMQAELKELGEDIKKNGLQQRIQLWPVEEPPGYVLLDGRNRLDAMEAVGLKLVQNPNATTVEEIFAGDNIRATLIAPIPAKAIDPVAYVISANIRRRHLTCGQKRTLIAELLRADPNRSNLWTAKLVGVDDKTVGSVRREMEARSEIPNVAATTDTKGRQQPIRKPKVVSVKPPPPPTPAQRVEEKIRQAAIADKKKHGDLSLARVMDEVIIAADQEELVALANHHAPERHTSARQWCESRGIEWKSASEKPLLATDTPEAAAEKRKALYARQDNAPDTDDDDLPALPPHTVGDPSRRKRSTDEVLANTMRIIEDSISVSVSVWREVGRIPEFWRRLHNLIDKLEAEEAAEAELQDVELSEASG